MKNLLNGLLMLSLLTVTCFSENIDVDSEPKIDKNDDGYVDFNELYQYLKNMKQIRIKKEFSLVFEEADTDNDGKISLEEGFEFTELSDLVEDNMQTENNRILHNKGFEIFDDDSNGVLNESEFYAYVYPEGEHKYHPKIAKLFLGIYDKSGDSFIKYCEIYSCENTDVEREREFHKTFDLNRDNKLDEGEILYWIFGKDTFDIEIAEETSSMYNQLEYKPMEKIPLYKVQENFLQTRTEVHEEF